MLEIVPIIPFHNSFNFILLFLKFPLLFPKLLHIKSNQDQEEIRTLLI
jgi:hypothetical protein